MNAVVRALWAYRGFILGSVKREFQSKYQNSLLGAAWTVLNPLAMITVYTVIFAEVMRAKLPGVDSTFGYSIFLCAGILTWALFSEIVGRAQNVFIDSANLLKKLSFPRLCLPVVIVFSALLNFSIIFGIFTVFLFFSGNFPGLAFFAIIPLLLILIVFSIGLGITLGVLNVFFRDVGQFFGIFITFWFWLTPIVYAPQALAVKLQGMLAWNPMAPLMQAFQGVLVSGIWPDWSSLWPISVLAAFFCLLGFRLFRRHAGEMVDEL
ncbi:ABC transporter permease [Uliginosibacterium aquaticum]|uniref:Transport permease protein n=1 Tax=Uliginosibacterium aquaticum TaxID=2731212 RepID=A0ABX2IBN6_9RHOO|nr:ABC transporter permease [Uliginosibacterium aquaticum]NSL53751.1 ABC transporter permease [Uliginosibacterium aquaticum]